MAETAGALKDALKCAQEDVLKDVPAGAQEGEVTVCLLDSPDEICGACPKRSFDGLRCAADGRSAALPDAAVRMDRALLAGLHLHAGQSYTYRELIRIAADGLTHPLYDEVCGTCSWSRKGVCCFERLQERLNDGVAGGLRTADAHTAGK
jgi:hypothetical protein